MSRQRHGHENRSASARRLELTRHPRGYTISESMPVAGAEPPQHLERVRRDLIAVIKEVQSASGLECPPLEGGTIPIAHVPEFDSTVAPAATSLLAMRVDIPIPDNVNIFVDLDGGSRSIDQVALAVCNLKDPRTTSKAPTHELFRWAKRLATQARAIGGGERVVRSV